jgi:hypothetical protein
MKIQEFLDRYDSVSETFTEDELFRLWIDDLFDEEDEDKIKEVRGEEYGEPHRWNVPVNKVIKIENRYFMIFCFQGLTECQESYYNIQPEEVEPYEITITSWRRVKNI